MPECARVELTCYSSSSSNTGCTSAASSTLSCVPCEDANTISKKSQIPPGEPDQLSQLEIEQESWFLQTLEEYYVKLNLSEFTPQNVQDYWIIGGIRSPRDKQRIFPVLKSIRVTRAEISPSRPAGGVSRVTAGQDQHRMLAVLPPPLGEPRSALKYLSLQLGMQDTGLDRHLKVWIQSKICLLTN